MKGNFNKLIDSQKPVLVDFHAEWCGPCKAYGPVYERVSNEFDDVIFAKINTEEEPQLGRMFNIRSIPTTIAFKEQIGVFVQPGALPEAALRDLVVMLKDLDMDDVTLEQAVELIAAKMAKGGTKKATPKAKSKPKKKKATRKSGSKAKTSGTETDSALTEA